MSYSDEIAENTRKVVSQMEHSIVLNVCGMADDNFVDVTTNYGVIPNAGVVANGHVAYDHCAFCNVDILPQGWFLAEMGIELLH